MCVTVRSVVYLSLFVSCTHSFHGVLNSQKCVVTRYGQPTHFKGTIIRDQTLLNHSKRQGCQLFPKFNFLNAAAAFSEMFRQSLQLIRRSSKWFVLEFKAREIGSLSYKHFVVADKKDFPTEAFLKVNCFHLNCRNYSKSRDKKREKKKVLRIDENELKEYFDVEKLLSDMAEPLNTFKEELFKHTTLRSSLGAVENIKIQLDGDVYSIQDLAEVGKKNPRLIVLDFSAFPKAIPTVLSTLQNSELNVNVQQDGTKVFVPIPKVTKEHREVLAKKCKLYFVKCKDGIRDVQMKYTKSLGNIDKLSADEKFRITDQLAALGNKQISLAEGIMKEKQDELLKVDEVQ